MKKYTTVKTVMETHKIKWAYKLVLALFILSLFQGWVFFHPTELDSATLTSAKDVLTNSRLSYSTTLNGGHSIGATTIEITTSGQADNDTHHLFPGDSVTIGTGSYTVGTIVDDDTFTITSGLASGDNDDGDPIYVNQSGAHTISFTTASAVADGAIRVSVQATENDTNDSDSKPDRDGFDLYGVAENDITCPSDAGVGSPYDFESTEGEASDAAGSGWHTFQCRYSGSGSGSTALTMTIGDYQNQTLLNPAPTSLGGGHTQGTADPYTIRIQNLAGISGEYAVVDSVDVTVVVIEAVRVTATVEETLSFTIAGRSSGNTHCGHDADVTTQLYSVPFGSLTLPNNFYDAAQQLTVSTNASDGYSVTVFEDDELGKDGADSPYIPDTACNATGCDHTTSQDWNVATGYDGFGYSLENVGGGSDAKFTYNESSRTFSAKHFPNRTEDYTPPYQDEENNANIMSHGSPIDSASIYVCYRITVTGIQQAGNYYNTITYIATPQF